MSLRFNDAKMPRLSDKHAEQAAQAEDLRETEEKKDLDVVRLIKKVSPKKTK